MKKINLLAFAAILAVGTVVLVNKLDVNENTLLEQNVEALSRGEFDPMGLCSTYCVYNFEYDCVLKTNNGFDITCEKMRSWL